jgi:hypothetical protein
MRGPREGRRLTLRRQGFWLFVLVVIGLDLWWSGTPTGFEWWWLPLFAANAMCLGLILLPLIRGRP